MVGLFDRRSRGGRFCISVALVAALSCAGGSFAYAAGLESELKQATQDYDRLLIPQAEKRLEKAISKAIDDGVTEPVVSRLYLMLGIVRFAVSRDENDAFEQFVEALKVDPDARLDTDYETPTLSAIMDRARAAAPPPVENGDVGEPEVIGRADITHREVETAKAGEAVEFVASVSETVPLYRVVLNFRYYGQREFTPLEMKPDTGTQFLARLEGPDVRSSQIDYFIEVLDRTGGILASSGTPTSPNNIVVFGGEADDLPPDDKKPSPAGRQHVYLAVGAGAGFGLATATPEVNNDLNIDPGLAPAVMHIQPELGLIATESLDVGVFYRFQIEPGSGDQNHLVGGKLKWWFDNEGSLRLYSSVGGGYGYVRHTVNLAPVREFVDTTLEGPLHGGVGFGMGVALGDHVMLIADIYSLFLFPEISGHVDATFGVRTSF